MLIRATHRSGSNAQWRFPALMRGIHIYWALLLLAVCVTDTSSAQVKNCGGIFTDRPCNETSISESTLTMRPTAKPSAEEIRSLIEARSTIQTLIHDLRTKRFNAQRRYSIRVDISEAEAACGRRETNLDRCRGIVQQLDKQLDDQIAQHTTPKVTSTATPVPPKLKKTPEPKRTPAPEKTTVTQENNSVVIIQQQTRPRSTPWFVIESSPLYPLHRDETSHRSRNGRNNGASRERGEGPRPPPQQGPPLRMDPPTGSPSRSSIVDSTRQ